MCWSPDADIFGVLFLHAETDCSNWIIPVSTRFTAHRSFGLLKRGAHPNLKLLSVFGVYIFFSRPWQCWRFQSWNLLLHGIWTFDNNISSTSDFFFWLKFVCCNMFNAFFVSLQGLPVFAIGVGLSTFDKASVSSRFKWKTILSYNWQQWLNLNHLLLPLYLDAQGPWVLTIFE